MGSAMSEKDVGKEEAGLGIDIVDRVLGEL